MVYTHFPPQSVPKPTEHSVLKPPPASAELPAPPFQQRGFRSLLFHWSARFLESWDFTPCWVEPFICLNVVFVPVILLKREIWIQKAFLEGLLYPHVFFHSLPLSLVVSLDPQSLEEGRQSDPGFSMPFACFQHLAGESLLLTSEATERTHRLLTFLLSSACLCGYAVVCLPALQWYEFDFFLLSHLVPSHFHTHVFYSYFWGFHGDCILHPKMKTLRSEFIPTWRQVHTKSWLLYSSCLPCLVTGISKWHGYTSGVHKQVSDLFVRPSHTGGVTNQVTRLVAAHSPGRITCDLHTAAGLCPVCCHWSEDFCIGLLSIYP